AQQPDQAEGAESRRARAFTLFALAPTALDTDQKAYGERKREPLEELSGFHRSDPGVISPRETAVANGTELVASIPVRPRVAVRERTAELVIGRDVLKRTGQIPFRIEFVRGLMISLRGVIVPYRLACFLASVHQIETAVRIEHGNADLGETDVIGAIEIAF